MPVRLFVGNLSYDVTEAELRAHFTAIGPLSTLALPTDRDTGKPRGFAFVEMSTDEEAAKANPFFPGRVAHGYLLLAFAAGLFVDPAPGPVLANYGLDKLRFLKPVSPGDRIKVRLTAKAKTRRTDGYGDVRWDVVIVNQDDETVATYDLLTMNAM